MFERDFSVGGDRREMDNWAGELSKIKQNIVAMIPEMANKTQTGERKTKRSRK